MRCLHGVFATDGVNRAKILLPLSVLVESIESHISGCAVSGRPVGMPSNISHDSCRPIGWSVSKSVLMTGGVARQLGAILTPETPEDFENINTALMSFRQWSRDDGVAPFADDLRARTADLEGPQTRFWYLEGAAIARPGLAAQAYPELFAGGEFADKDGVGGRCSGRAARSPRAQMTGLALNSTARRVAATAFQLSSALRFRRKPPHIPRRDHFPQALRALRYQAAGSPLASVRHREDWRREVGVSRRPRSSGSRRRPRLRPDRSARRHGRADSGCRTAIDAAARPVPECPRPGAAMWIQPPAAGAG
jgi:hypothetical protein